MMKKTLFLLSTLLLAGIGAKAQTVIHECEAEESHWTTDGTTGIGLNTWSVEADASGMVVPFMQLWVWSGDATQPSLEAATVSHERMTNLTAGYYEVSLDIRIFSEAGNEIGEGTTFNANGVSADLLTEGATGTYATDDYPNMTEVYGTYHLLVYVTNDTLDISINIPEGVGYNWISWKNLEVTYLGETPVGYDAHECTANVNHWTIANNTNGDFHYNDWSTEDDASGMVVPFLEYWVWSGEGNLSAATISHTQLTNLTAGYYSVTLDIRIFSEAGNEIGTGTTFAANTASVDIVTGGDHHDDTYGTETEVYGTYTLICEVTEDGKLDISVTIPDGVTYNWISFKNLSVVYMGTSLEYSIGAPECSASCVKPGNTVTITFPDCITPNVGETPTLSTSVSIMVGSTAVTDASLSYNGTTATVTFTMPESVGYGAEVTVSVPEGLLSWSGTSVSNAAATFTLTTPAIADQTGVYLYSTHAKGFLSRGGEHTYSEAYFDSYGKIATTDPYGIPVDITIDNDGFATVKFLDSNLYLYGGEWAWTDGLETNAAKYWVEEVTTDDGETVYQFSYEGNADNYLYVNDDYWYWVANNGNLGGDNNLDSDITRTYWQIFTMAKRDAYKEKSILADHVAIAALAGETVESEDDFLSYLTGLSTTDVTDMVSDHELASSTESLTGWDVTEYWTDNYIIEADGNEVHYYFTTNSYGTEIYKADARLLQKVENLNEGIYKVTLQGFVRQGYADNIIKSGLDNYDLSIGFLQANGYQTNLKPWATEADLTNKLPDGMENAWGPNNDGTRTYDNELYTYVSDGTLELSINCPDILDGGWMMFKNLTLTYLSEDLTYSIGAPTCAANCVQPGSTVTITFPNCTTPNADETPTLSGSQYITVNDEAVTDATLTYSGIIATVTFTMPESIGYGETVIVNVPAGLLTWTNANPTVSSAAATFPLTTPAIANQTGVYLYSTHAKGFLSRGGEHTYSEAYFDSYGKIATTDPYGIPVDITIGDNGFATVKFLDSNLYLYGGEWAWTDGSEIDAAKYTIDVLEVEGETVYQFSYDGNDDNYLYVNDDCWDWVANDGNFNDTNNLQGDETRTYWQIFTKEERDAYKEASILADHIAIATLAGETVESEDDFLSYLTGLSAIDVTDMVADAALAGSLDGWDVTEYWTDNYIIEADDNQVDIYFTTNSYGTEIYMADTRLLQTVSGLDAGIYKVTLQGFVRQGWANTIVNDNKLTEYDLSIGFLQANDYHTNLKPWATEADLTNKLPDGMDNAWGPNNDGTRTYANELYTYVGEDGTLELSINCPDILDGGWMIFKNLTLTYYAESIDWTLGASYGTLILPFDYDLSEDDNTNGLMAYTVASITEEGDDSATLELSEGITEIAANTPYIIGGTEGEYTFIGIPTNDQNSYTSEDGYLTGYMVEGSAPAGSYVLQLQDAETGPAFYLVESESEITVGAYHCYLNYNTTSGAKLVVYFPDSDVATAIEAVEATEETAGSETVYDLSGRRVAKAQKGVYIVNGKKMVIK